MIRADASPRIGGGHISRCLSLAGRLQDAGWTCYLATGPETMTTWPSLKEGLAILPVAGSDQAAQLRALLPAGCDLLIVDHYGLDKVFESACREWARRILVIDDLANRPHDADWLLDQTPGRQPADYAGQTPANCQMLTGADYALLRPEFAQLRQITPHRTTGLESILVTFGASDPLDMTGLAVMALAKSGLALQIDAVVGADFENMETLEQAVATSPATFRFHRATNRIAYLMAQADLCIGAGGVTALERCCLGLPSLIIRTAENQTAMVAALASAGAILDLGPAAAQRREHMETSLQAALLNLTQAPDALSAMSQAAASVCDARGTWRVLLNLLPSRMNPLGHVITLRLATATDTEQLFIWQTWPGIRRFFRQPRPPEWREHCDWMTRTLADPDQILLIAEADQAPSAMIRLDVTEPAVEVSILVAPERQGQGIGKAVLLMAAEIFPQRPFRADVHPGNETSRRLFEAAGYHAVSPERYELPARLS